MDPTIRQELARASAETAEQVAAATASCADTAKDIRRSKAAIQRSLDLLSSTAGRIEKQDISTDADVDGERSAD